jgi:hypothetical protein
MLVLAIGFAVHVCIAEPIRSAMVRRLAQTKNPIGDEHIELIDHLK